MHSPSHLRAALLAPLAPLALLAAGCASARRAAPPRAAEEVAAAERAFAADAKAIGTGAAFKRWIAPDAITYTVDSTTGRLAVIAAKPRVDARPDRPPAGAPPLEWWPTFAGAARSGDLGYTTGPYFAGDRGHGWIFTVWRRQGDGGWKWIYDGGPSTAERPPRAPDALLAVLPLAASGAGSAARAIAEVDAIERELAREAAADVPAAHLRVLAPDARVMGSGAQPATERAAHAAELARWGKALLLTPRGAEGSAAGDLVFTHGEASLPTVGEPVRGAYMRIWQRRGDGWQLVLAQLLDPPPPPRRPS